MKIAITLDTKDENGKISNVFGRCLYFGIYDSENKSLEFKKNEAKNQTGGAGIMAAQIIIDLEVGKVISGDFGPKAKDVLEKANIEIQKEDNKTLKELLNEIS